MCVNQGWPLKLNTASNLTFCYPLLTLLHSDLGCVCTVEEEEECVVYTRRRPDRGWRARVGKVFFGISMVFEESRGWRPVGRDRVVAVRAAGWHILPSPALTMRTIISLMMSYYSSVVVLD